MLPTIKSISAMDMTGIGVGLLGPLAIAQGAVSLPEGAPWWLPYAVSAATACAVPIVGVFARAAKHAAVGWFRARAAAKRKRAAEMLGDADKANDATAQALLAAAAAEDGAADGIENSGEIERPR